MRASRWSSLMRECVSAVTDGFNSSRGSRNASGCRRAAEAALRPRDAPHRVLPHRRLLCGLLHRANPKDPATGKEIPECRTYRRAPLARGRRHRVSHLDGTPLAMCRRN